LVAYTYQKNKPSLDIHPHGLPALPPAIFWPVELTFTRIPEKAYWSGSVSCQWDAAQH
jgi:hypothetical protein